MPMAGSRKALIAILIVIGLYFLIDHVNPLPLNHEYIGLGNFHIAHAVFGVVLIGGALYLWRMSRTASKALPAAPQATSQQ